MQLLIGNGIQKKNRFLKFALLSLSFLVLYSFFSTPSAEAAVGDITAVRILGDAKLNGWAAEVDIEGLNTGGTYSFGLGTNNASPETAKVVFTVTSPGYDASGNATTTTRTIYGTQYVRKVYPNEAQADESSSGGTLTVKIALSDFIYDPDSTITASFASGFYTNGASTNAINNVNVANNSNLAYPEVIGRWAWPGYERVTDDFLVEAVVFNRFAKEGKPVAAVKFTASDQSGNSVSVTTSEMTRSARSGDANQVLVYAATIPISGLDQGEVIDVNFEAYPWVGETSAKLDTRTTADGFAQPNERIGPMHQLNDKDETYGLGYAYISSTGNDTTGTVYSSQGAAEAGNAFLTFGKAAEAIRTYNNTNFSRNNPGGGTILVAEGNYTFPGFTPASDLGAMDTWLTVKPASSADRANTTINLGSNATFRVRRLKVEGLNLAPGSSAVTFRGDVSLAALWLHDNLINYTVPATLLYGYLSVYATQNDITSMPGGMDHFSTQKSPYALIRGNNSTPIIDGTLYNVIGNKNISPFTFYNSGNAQGHEPSDNIVYAFNSLYNFNTSNLLATTSAVTKGMAFVQNILESISATQPLLSIAADGSTSNPVNNVLVWNNTLAGQRMNIGYNDQGTTALDRFNYSQRFNSLSDWNNKDDTFGTQNANRTGGWSVGYNVGTIGNLTKISNFPGEFNGLSTFYVANPQYTLDASQDGTDVGNGDYTLSQYSPNIDLGASLTNSEQTLPFDFLGNEIYGAMDSGAYEYQPPLTMGTNPVTTSAPIRVYGNEKFRNKSAPGNGNTADFNLQIPGSDKVEWLDINISTWENTGTRHKVWTESTNLTTITNTVHVIGDLQANTYYEVEVDSVLGQNITGGSCVSGSCLSNGSGQITFTYTGSYSSHTFDVEEDPTPPDVVAPVIAQVTAVSTPTNDTTPNYTFSSTEAGAITYGGSCSSATTSASSGNNTITFNTLSEGTYNNCTIRVTDSSSNQSNLLSVNTFTVDTTAPAIAQVTAVPTPTNDTTPNYTFSSDQVGSISYGGSCTSVTMNVTSGNNTITFDTLSEGTYSNCTIRVTDGASNQSNILTVNTFTIDTTAPSVAQVTPVPSPTNDTTPNYTFSSTEAGTITYGGSCTASTGSASSGNNTITFNTLSNGTYSNCTIRVTDASSNQSSVLAVNTFTVDITAATRSNGSPSGVLTAGTTSTTMSLNTNETATCKYSASAGTAYSSMTETFDSTNSTSHLENISGLNDGTSYTFFVRCSDGADNQNTDDYSIAFSVAAAGDTTGPVISNISSGTPGESTTTINWNTDEAADSRVEYGLTTSYGSNQSSSADVTSHSLTLSGLTAGTLYHYRVISADPSSNSTTSTDQTFTTSSPANTPEEDDEDDDDDKKKSSSGSDALGGASITAASSSCAKTSTIGVTLNENIQLGSRGSEVKLLQEYLVQKGYLQTEYITCYFGEITQAALLRYQNDMKIPSSGIVDAPTRETLEKEMTRNTAEKNAETSSNTAPKNLMANEKNEMAEEGRGFFGTIFFWFKSLWQWLFF